MEFGVNNESSLANEYCTKFKDNFLNLFDTPIEDRRDSVFIDQVNEDHKSYGDNDKKVCTCLTGTKHYMLHNCS